MRSLRVFFFSCFGSLAIDHRYNTFSLKDIDKRFWFEHFGCVCVCARFPLNIAFETVHCKNLLARTYTHCIRESVFFSIECYFGRLDLGVVAQWTESVVLIFNLTFKFRIRFHEIIRIECTEMELISVFFS